MWLLSLPTSVFAAVALFAALNSSEITSPTPAPRELLPWRLTLVQQDSTFYTEEQAEAGAALFGRICAECHEKKDVAGADFRAKWTGRALFELFELVRTTMPDSNPGGLTRDEYAGALAYILKLNGLPAGTTAIMPDSAAMQAAKLLLPPPTH